MLRILVVTPLCFEEDRFWLWCSEDLTFSKLYHDAVHRFDLPCSPAELSIAGELICDDDDRVLPYAHAASTPQDQQVEEMGRVGPDGDGGKVPLLQLVLKTHPDICTALLGVFALYSMQPLGIAGMTALQ
jgi:hypothetical protein